MRPRNILWKYICKAFGHETSPPYACSFLNPECAPWVGCSERGGRLDGVSCWDWGCCLERAVRCRPLTVRLSFLGGAVAAGVCCAGAVGMETSFQTSAGVEYAGASVISASVSSSIFRAWSLCQSFGRERRSCNVRCRFMLLVRAMLSSRACLLSGRGASHWLPPIFLLRWRRVFLTPRRARFFRVVLSCRVEVDRLLLLLFWPEPNPCFVFCFLLVFLPVAVGRPLGTFRTWAGPAERARLLSLSF